MWHPLSGWEPHSLGWLFAMLGAVSLVLFLRVEGMGRRLRNARAPLGVVSLSRSLSAEESRAILDSWEEEGRVAAQRHLLADYALIPVFSTCLAVLGLLAAGWFDQQGAVVLRDAAVVLAWGQWLVGLVDFAEDTTLLRVVHTYPWVPQDLIRFAGWWGRLKFLLIFLSMGACGYALLAQWVG